MDYTTVENLVRLAFIAGAAMFVLGLHLMNSPATARNGNRLSAAGMVVAVVAELILITQGTVGPYTWPVIVLGFLVGGGAGLWMARNVAMTAMPQLVSL